MGDGCDSGVQEIYSLPIPLCKFDWRIFMISMSKADNVFTCQKRNSNDKSNTILAFGSNSKGMRITVKLIVVRTSYNFNHSFVTCENPLAAKMIGKPLQISWIVHPKPRKAHALCALVAHVKK